MSVSPRLVRAGAALVLVLAAGGIGYRAAGSPEPQSSIPVQTASAIAPGTTRIIYSLDKKQNDQEIIAVINGAKTKIYFAIYTFTLSNIADALIAAKARGVAVYGVVDGGQASTSYSAPVIEKLLAAGIPVVSEKHATGNGIMHLKTLVTDSTYVTGSYNWTHSATTINDEVLEIGTDPGIRQAYENILRALFERYRNNPALSQERAGTVSIGTISYTEAPRYVGEYASVRGKLLEAYTSSSGTVFLDFCHDYKSCPFSGVIFADDAPKFGDLSRYNGSVVVLSGKIVLYKNRAEIVLKNPSQLKTE